MKENSIKKENDRRFSCKEKSVKSQKNKKNMVMQKLVLILFLGGVFLAVKTLGGVYSHSLALLTDAIHMFTDLFAFLVTIIAVWISNFPANNLHSFGYQRAGVIGALVSILLVWVMYCFLVYYAIERIMDLSMIVIHAKLMFYVACFGLIVNLIMVYILQSSSCLVKGFFKNLCKKRKSKQSRYSEGSVPEILAINESITQLLIETSGDRQNASPKCCNELSKDEESKVLHAHIDEESHLFDDKIDNHHDETRHQTHLEKSVNMNQSKKNTEKETLQEKNHMIVIRATMLHIFADLLQSLSVIIASLIIWKYPEDTKIVDPILTFVFAFVIFIPSLSIIVECCSVLMEGSPRGFNICKFEDQLRRADGVREIHDLHIWCPNIGQKALSVHIFTDEPRTGPVLKRVTALCRANGIQHSTVQVETTQDKEHQYYINCEHRVH